MIATLRQGCRGFEGGLLGPPFMGCNGEISPLHGGWGAFPPRNYFFLEKRVTFFPRFSCRLNFHVHCWEVFRHMVFVDGFLFPAKELGLLTNPCHWVRFLDVDGSYMYIVL
jgi:hypothetical protein